MLMAHPLSASLSPNHPGSRIKPHPPQNSRHRNVGLFMVLRDLPPVLPSIRSICHSHTEVRRLATRMKSPELLRSPAYSKLLPHGDATPRSRMGPDMHGPEYKVS